MSYAPSKQFLLKYGLKYPIIQSPMAGVSTTSLASIVAKSGALGSLALAGINLIKTPEKPLNDAWKQFKDLTGEPSPAVNLNFFCHDFELDHQPTQEELDNWNHVYDKSTAPDVEISAALADYGTTKSNISVKEVESNHPHQFRQFLNTLESIKPTMVSFHFGHPSLAAIKELQSHNISVFVTATSVQEAQKLAALGVDGITLQGYEAGGHRGNFLASNLMDENLSTMALFAQVKHTLKDTKNKPFLVPSGGIVDGATINYYLSNGAAAVQVGTVFIPTPESSAPDFIKNQIIAARGIPTTMTKLVSGKPARALRTPFIEQLTLNYEQLQSKKLPDYGYAYHRYKALAGQLKREEYGFYLAGQNYHLIDAELDTKGVMQKLINELSNSGFANSAEKDHYNL